MRVVVFDAYGTLWDVSQIDQACHQLVGPQLAGPFFRLWRQKQLEYAFLRTLMGQYVPFDTVTRQALDYTVEHYRLTPSPEAVNHMMEAWFEPTAFPDAVDALAGLKGFERLILSNGNPEMLTRGVAATQMGHFLSAVLSVDAVRLYKPHPRAYQLVLNHYSVTQQEVVFVSSNGWDIAGAGNFGFRPVWINRQNAPREELGISPHAVLSSLEELAQWMRSANFRD